MPDASLERINEYRYAVVIMAVCLLAGVLLCWTLFPDGTEPAKRIFGGLLAGTLGGLCAVGNRMFG